MGERDDGLALSLSLGFSQPKEPSLRFNRMPSITSSSFPHMQNHNNNHLPQKAHHNAWPHLFQFSGTTRITPEKSSDAGSFLRGFDVDRAPSVTAAVDLEEEAAGVSSPNSNVSSVSGNKRDLAAPRGRGGDENQAERDSCSHGGGSDDEDGGNGDGSRKKLRLSKEQALVLEETFKEHSTLNPKQKLALAKQLNLRTRQVEVWFQNRRASFTVTLMVIAATIAIRVNGNEFSHHQEVKILRHLKRLNKPAVKSIKSEDGDIIDCVPVTNQPAFDHPLLKHHTIQMRPSFIPESDSKYITKEAKTTTQVWHKAGECPDNTVPIRRTKKEDLLRPKSIESFGRKPHHSIPQTTTFDPTKGHQYAIMSAMNETFYGTEVSINLWKPYVQVPEEFSLAQTWIVSGSGSSLNTIEAGWQVYPELYDDNQKNNPRLFVYWTRDGYRTTGCYNLLCSGFVQISNRNSVGGAYNIVSRYGGTQYEIAILIFKDRKTGNWWLRVGNDIIGYWPGSLFTSLGNGATRVQWGGEIVNLEAGGKHTSTDMGSGHFADEGFRKASYVRNLKIVDDTNTLREPKSLYYFADNHNCYNVKTGSAGTSWGIHFFYGGSGHNVKCP